MIWALAATLAAVVVGVFLIRPRLRGLFSGDFQGVKTEAFIAPILTLTVFLCAFMVAQASSTYQRANQSASTEGSAVQLLYENAGMLPNGSGQALQAASVCYARAVHHLEWPAMENGESSPVVDGWAETFNREIPSITSGPGAIVGQVVGLNRTQSEARATRLNEAAPHLPVLTLALMIFAVVTVVLILSSFAVADMRRRVLLALALPLALLLGFTPYLVETLEEPFSGLIQIKPSVITTVETNLGANFAVTYPGAVLPCDAEGNPR